MLIVPTEKQFDWKHAPIVLIAIVLVNILVFLLYQSNDNAKAIAAMGPFVELGYVEKEWPIYTAYLESTERVDDLHEYEKLYRQKELWSLSQVMLWDTAYYKHVMRAARSEFSYDDYLAWKGKRTEIQESFNSMSSFSYGLRSTDVSAVTLFSHQFLHGDLMHLVGNMVFLVVFGFAVEAAIGHFRFLLFYLIGGVFAGLAQVVTTLGSEIPLVGASGAISGVTAMYLAVFRLKKIEFFYWVLFFVGYIRAPALLVLPFYIAKEVYSYMTVVDSNVAFMAHAGGFVAGAILIGIALLFNKDVLNDEYIDQDQKISPRAQSLAEIYKAIEALRFDYALKLVNKLIAKAGIDFELAVLRFNLDKIKKENSFTGSFCSLMTLKNLTPDELKAVNKLWLETDNASTLLPQDEQLKLAFQFTTLKDLSGAEHILDGLFEEKFKPSELLLLCSKLANRFAEKHDHGRNMKYQEMAQALTKEGHHGVV